SDPWLYVGGNFTTYQSQSNSGMMRVDTTAGNIDLSWLPSLPVVTLTRAISAIAVGASDIYAVGQVDEPSAGSVRGIVRIDAATAAASDAGAVDFDSPPRTLIADANGLVVGGAHTFFGGFPAPHFAKIFSSTGLVDSTFAGNGAPNDVVRAIAIAYD